MQFFSYKVNQKHRVAKPTEDASIWTVSPWIEVQLFGEASQKNWRSTNKDWLWAMHGNADGAMKLGLDLQNDLYIAKFRCDHNQEWHGYPVHPRDADIPPDSVLEHWRKDALIDKTTKRRIEQGKFK